MKIPDTLKYSTDHEWIRVEGDVATIGITDFAQDALGDVVFVELPDVGSATTNGEAISEVESTKSVSDIVAPVSGTIASVNEALDADPTALNTDPYGDGWICSITMTDPGQLDDLLDAEAYKALTE